jgi:hypothetical protein
LYIGEQNTREKDNEQECNLNKIIRNNPQEVVISNYFGFIGFFSLSLKKDSVFFYFSFPKSKFGFEKWTFINVQKSKMKNTFEKISFFSAITP